MMQVLKKAQAFRQISDRGTVAVFEPKACDFARTSCGGDLGSYRLFCQARFGSAILPVKRKNL